ncbi:MAG: nitroreductase family protein [Bacteroidales bacterium]|nr:nitroreductase family protein [Bacteroidales bacterium]MCD8395413.1 nitroreductase family protein [Bacteroidales bacterium]
MEFKEVIKERYSCKKYLSRPVDREQLTAILEAGRMAPTAKNLQEQHVYVLESQEALAWIDAVTPCRYGAPTCLVVTYDKDNVYTYPGGKRTSGIEDAVIVATHLMLGAKDAGVESCWLNNFDPDRLHQLMRLPQNEEVVMILDLGYPAIDGGEPLPNHFKRKPLTDTVTYL